MKKFLFAFIFIAAISAHAQVPFFKATIYDSSAVKGYFFIVSEEHVMILDRFGNTVYYKHVSNGTDSDFKLQPNGKMTYFFGGKFRLIDSTFRVVDSVGCKNYETDFHEIKILPDGHFLLFGREKVKMNLSKYHWRGEHGTDTSTIRSGVLQELDAKKNVVFEWHAKDHFAFDDVDTFRYVFSMPWWNHWNSLDVDKNGNILVSCRNFNEITKINRVDGSIIWRLGGKRNQFKFINCPEPFYSQRNIRVLPNGDITLFDGGNGVEPHGARGMEFQIDEKNKTATLKWSYAVDSSVTSIAWGNMQRLNHFNTLIDVGSLQDSLSISPLCLVIVDSLGKKLFQLNGFRAFRTYYYDALPFQLHRPQVTCFDSLGRTYLKTIKSYTSYWWSDSSTARAVPITKAGAYFVFVPYGEGGYISSEKITLTDVAHPCPAIPSSSGKNKTGSGKKRSN